MILNTYLQNISDRIYVFFTGKRHKPIRANFEKMRKTNMKIYLRVLMKDTKNMFQRI
jgi:hypothetical protein